MNWEAKKTWQRDTSKFLKTSGTYDVKITNVKRKPSKKGLPQIVVEMTTDTGLLVSSWFTKGIPRSEEEYVTLCLAIGASPQEPPESLVGKTVQIDTFLTVSKFRKAGTPTAAGPSGGDFWGTSAPTPLKAAPPAGDPWGSPPPMGDSDIPF